jgi:hypothetical protein
MCHKVFRKIDLFKGIYEPNDSFIGNFYTVKLVFEHGFTGASWRNRSRPAIDINRTTLHAHLVASTASLIDTRKTT